GAMIAHPEGKDGVQVERRTIGDHFNPGIGFVRRDDINKDYAMFRFSPRPHKGSRVQKYTFEAALAYIENTSGRLAQRDQIADFAIDFQNGDRFATTYAD